MIYTYYYGVLCHGCENFAAIKEYLTNTEFALTDVTWEGQMRVECPHQGCHKSDVYSASELVYSSEKQTMRPLCPS
jgi:hypothetical protein